MCPVADHGFPRRSANILFGNFFGRNCMKMKEIGPKGDASVAPPKGPPLWVRDDWLLPSRVHCNYFSVLPLFLDCQKLFSLMFVRTLSCSICCWWIHTAIENRWNVSYNQGWEYFQFWPVSKCHAEADLEFLDWTRSILSKLACLKTICNFQWIKTEFLTTILLFR